MKQTLLFRLKQNFGDLIPNTFKRRLKKLINKQFRKEDKERKRLKSLPRFTVTDTIFLNKKIRIADSASFQFMCEEIFERQIYKITDLGHAPYIIDCGANIGLGIMYFKTLYPAAEITAFEPDEKIAAILKHNVDVFEFTNVEVIEKACWNKETTLAFVNEGADAGRVANDFDSENLVRVKTVRLRDYLNKKVDFLKIDIEGAEAVVLLDIKDRLMNVDRIFLEFHSFIDLEQMLPEILNVLKAAGFRLHISSPALFSYSPFYHLDSFDKMDNQLNIHAFRNK